MANMTLMKMLEEMEREAAEWQKTIDTYQSFLTGYKKQLAELRTKMEEST